MNRPVKDRNYFCPASVGLVVLAAIFLTWLAAAARKKGMLILDWAIFSNCLDSLGAFGSPMTLWESFGRPVNHFSVHGHFILAPLSIIYSFTQSYVFLIGFVFFTLSLSAWLLSNRGAALGEDRKYSLFTTLFVVLFLPFWSQALPGFHPETFAVLGIIGFAYFNIKGVPLAAAFFALLAAISREEMGLVIALLAGAMFFTEKDLRKSILASALPGLVFSAVSVYIVWQLKEHSNDGGFSQQIISARYGDLLQVFKDSPTTVFDDRPERLRFLAVIFLPLLPALAASGKRALWLVVAIPGLAANLASSYQFQWSDAFYYQSSFLPVLFLVFAEGFTIKSPRRKLRMVASFLLLVLVVPFSHSLDYMIGGKVLLPSGKEKVWRVAETQVLGDMRMLAEKIPPDGTVAISGQGLADYIDRGVMPLEGAFKNRIKPDFILLRSDKDNFEPRWKVSREALTEYININYSVADKSGAMLLFKLK